MSDYLACDCFICDCAECRIGGDRQPIPRFHDCAYIAARKRLIPEAEKVANEKVAVVSPTIDSGKSAARWTHAFSTAMDALSAQLLNGQR